MSKKSLVIVESPTKEKIISKYLGQQFVVKSSFGHVRDLPLRSLGVDDKKDFAPSYVIIPKSRKVIASLKKLSKEMQHVYLATDFDREGEAIAWHLIEVLQISNNDYSRITFHEITPTAIKEALNHARKIEATLVDSQQARRILDRLVGYKLSPLLWRKIYRGLSAGRVQSVAVRLICDREEEIESFKAQEFWNIIASLKKQEGPNFNANLIRRSDKKYEKFDIGNIAVAQEILDALSGAQFTVESVEKKERKRQPLPPYITSTMQQDASRRLGFSSSKTMLVAQSLYEGVELPEGGVGLITYMRTDSFNIAASAKEEALSYIKNKIGAEYAPLKPRIYKTKSKTAQEAHEAIRPTSVIRHPDELKEYLSKDQYRLYQLIWNRFLASQMTDALFDTQSVEIIAQAKEKFTFRTSGQVLKFPGFLKVFQLSDNGAEEVKELPELSVGDKLALLELLKEQHFTEPAPRFNEASLIKIMEQHGIGRPSTYAPTIKNILSRGYVRLEEKKFIPSELGIMVNKELKEHFPDIVDINFTAWVEERLDFIAEGKAPWQEVILEFYTPFLAALKKAEQEMKKLFIEPIKTDEKCKVCGAAMILRQSRFGKFLSCSNYPQCKFKMSLKDENAAEMPDEKCGECASPMIMKAGRKGKFLACSRFPECWFTVGIDKEGNKVYRPQPKPTDIKCEKCGKMMLLREGKKGAYLTCSGFPRCRNLKKVAKDFTLNKKTIP
ncbi:MAG: type I DNA topoisomerase [bacterium]